MEQFIKYVGLDVHGKSIAVAVAVADGGSSEVPIDPLKTGRTCAIAVVPGWDPVHTTRLIFGLCRVRPRKAMPGFPAQRARCCGSCVHAPPRFSLRGDDEIPHYACTSTGTVTPHSPRATSRAISPSPMPRKRR